MYNTWPPKYLISIPEQHKCVYDIHNNRDHIDEGDRVKGDRGGEMREGGRKERGGGTRKRVGERWRKNEGERR